MTVNAAQQNCSPNLSPQSSGSPRKSCRLRYTVLHTDCRIPSLKLVCTQRAQPFALIPSPKSCWRGATRRAGNIRCLRATRSGIHQCQGTPLVTISGSKEIHLLSKNRGCLCRYTSPSPVSRSTRSVINRVTYPFWELLRPSTKAVHAQDQQAE